MAKWALVALGLLAPSAALAAGDDDARFVDRPLALSVGHAQLETGLGIARTRDATEGLAAGTNLEATFGLPVVGDVSVRTGARFGGAAERAGADTYGRLFDHETSNLGDSAWANPEIRLRGQLLDLDGADIGIETRFVVPLGGSVFAVSPAALVRIHLGSFARLDTGIGGIFGRDQSPLRSGTAAVSVPAQLWLSAGDAFFGLMTGLRYNAGPASSTDIPAGVGLGYTFARTIDVKADLYAARVNDSSWSTTLGGGLGIAARVP